MFEEGRGVRLFGIADHVVGLDHIRESAGLDLGGAACDDDLGAGPLAARLADRLPRLAHGLRRPAQVFTIMALSSPASSASFFATSLSKLFSGSRFR